MAWLATQVVGVVNAHSQSQRLNLGHGFESLYRVAGSATQMLRKKKIYVAVQELFTFQNYFWNNKLFGCTNQCIAPKYSAISYAWGAYIIFHSITTPFSRLICKEK